ncbi:hypothetical protein H920_19331 [Fukomys damarensis]|uniref:Uncharacterized protein n=1 Tax=Fukomys damarensis TaxID=885580 RepID=A0A091D8Y9_FUKDA|nr:hypothetical protein H920_19331 [Fukomys damarensis]
MTAAEVLMAQSDIRRFVPLLIASLPPHELGLLTFLAAHEAMDLGCPSLSYHSDVPATAASTGAGMRAGLQDPLYVEPLSPSTGSESSPFLGMAPALLT